MFFSLVGFDCRTMSSLLSFASVVFSLVSGCDDSDLSWSLDWAGGFSGIEGCTPSMASQWARSDTPIGSLGRGAEVTSVRSTSFSSRKWSSRPPPDV